MSKGILSITICFILILSGCSDTRKDRIDFLHAHGVKETEKIPEDLNSEGWKLLGGDYVYFMSLFDEGTDPKMLYILADKNEKKLLGVWNINDQICPAAIARGVFPPTIVTNYEEMRADDVAKANDMKGLNELLRTMPGMKNFSWKNELQNKIASGIILKTQFIFVSKNSIDDSLFSFSSTPVKQDHDKLLKDILKADHAMYYRPVDRLNETVEMNQYVEKLKFTFSESPNAKISDYEPRFINDLLGKEQIDFSGSGKLFLFFPFKSFTRVPEKGGNPLFSPAVETFEFIAENDADGFPVFKRITHFASLLGMGLKGK